MITVGVAAYNAATVIPKLLDSLLAQDFPWDRMEIVVADNGSIDNTTDVVRRYMSRGPVRLVQAAHRRGPSVARNAVVAAARGEIIAFIDSDCIAHTEWLAEIEAGFADPTVGCVAGSILAAEPKTAVERYYARRGILSQEHVLSHSFLPYAQTANAAFRKEVFDRIGLFDEELITAEDSDVLWRMQLETGFRLCYRPEAVAWHRHRSTTAGLWRQTIGWGIGDAILYKKYRRHLRRDPWRRLLWQYRRILGLASLSLRRWVAVKLQWSSVELLEDAYLSLLFNGGLRLGRLKGSLASRVFYP